MSSDLHYLLAAVRAVLGNATSSVATWAAILVVLALLGFVVRLCFRVIREGGEIEFGMNWHGFYLRAKGRD